MEEKNELNDIILNKGGANSGSKKLLLAIATLTLILIIVLVIMNSLKSETAENPPKAVLPPEPTAPTEIVNDPLFEPVEVIQEGTQAADQTAPQEDLGQIAQKIKEESFQNAPAQQAAEPAAAPAPVQPKPAATVQQPAPAAMAPKPVQTKPQAPAKTAAPAVITPTIKKAQPEVKKTVAKPAEVKPVATKPAETTAPSAPVAAATQPKAPETKTENTAAQTYYIQVGSFTKDPNQVLFDRLNASGMKYTTRKSGDVTKVLVGPFQGDKAAREVLGTVRKNIEAGAYLTKG